MKSVILFGQCGRTDREITMRLFFLRHGIAEDVSGSGSDYDRELTPEGVQQMHSVAAAISRLDLGLDVIFASPLCRAVQTAEIVAHTLLLPEQPVVDERVGPGFAVEDIRAILRDHPDARRVLFVGHNPDLPMAAGDLVGSAHIDMKKAGLIRVDADNVLPGGGVLKWVLTPELLTR
jgi:phosphohistidine phosphatase